MQELYRTQGNFCDRVYYKDEDGNLVERIMQQESDDDVRQLLRENQEKAADFRPHKGNVRQVASVPAVLMLKWLHEAELAGWGGDNVMDYVYNKKIRDPENKFLLTVPENYRMKSYE